MTTTPPIASPIASASPTTARLDPGRPVVPGAGTLRPLGVGDVTIVDGFWGARQELNRTIIDHIEHWQEREGWLANFDLAAAGTLPAGRRGREFSDSEPYKLLEAMAWELGRRPDAALAARFDAIVARIAAAQDPDGYLSTRWGRPGQGARWSDLEWGHELYCMGHLMQAAVARARTGHPKDLLVTVAGRAADLICATFGPAGDQRICGHAEIELGLAELGRALGEPRYIEQAALFVERHGQGTLADIEWGRSYYQDDVPVRAATVFRGHAVRANYLAASAVDVGVEQRDADLVDAVTRQYDRTIAARTYLTGGQGSRHQDEGFGEDYQLPPDRAYSETCAAVGSQMVSWRLLLAHGSPRFADNLERTLYNVVATSPAPDGHGFYYANTLHRRVPGAAADPNTASKRADSSLRAPWFDVSCCPPNVARTLASLGAYVATVDDDGVQVHQYVAGEIRAELPDGSPVVLEFGTDYPAEGRIRIRVARAPKHNWTLTMRVPGWCVGGATVTVDRPDGRIEQRAAEPGLVVVDHLRPGAEVILDLDVTPRFVVADERVDAVRGCVAVQRGPEVWCLESVDLPGDASVADFRVDPGVAPRMADGRVVVRGRLRTRADGGDAAWPYAAPAVMRDGEEIDVPLVAYHDWANRGPSTMRVWLPVG